MLLISGYALICWLNVYALVFPIGPLHPSIVHRPHRHRLEVEYGVDVLGTWEDKHKLKLKNKPGTRPPNAIFPTRQKTDPALFQRTRRGWEITFLETGVFQRVGKTVFCVSNIGQVLFYFCF